MKLISRAWRHVLAASAVSMLLILPDYLFSLVNSTFRVGFRGDILAIFWIMAFLLIGIRNKVALIAFVVFFALLQLSQYLHFAYFGSLVAPHEVSLLFYEWQEIWDTLSGIGVYVSWPLIFVLACSAATVWLWRKTRDAHVRIPLASLWLLLLLAIIPLKAYLSPTAKNFYPNPKSFALKNTLYAFSYFLGRELPLRLTGKAGAAAQVDMSKYKPYVTLRKPLPGPMNIVIVMGESLSYSHMSLYGYGRETTPYLDGMRSDPNFVYRRAISGGVATKVSLPTFFNILREPDNLRHVVGYETNLLKMARDQGLKTHFLSVQTSNLTTYAGVEFADHYVTQEDIEPLFKSEKDSALLDLLKEVDLSGSNFIVLHQRNSHSPYDSSYPASFAKYPSNNDNFKEHMVNTYDNSVGYTDYVLHAILEQLKARSHVPTYFFFTSDHAEMMGEQGKFGHSLLEPDVARVPFLFYAIHGDPAVLGQVRELQEPTHYEIAKTIASVLGYEFRNPNEEPGVYYINGPDLDMSDRYMIVNKSVGSESSWTAHQFDANLVK